MCRKTGCCRCSIVSVTVTCAKLSTLEIGITHTIKSCTFVVFTKSCHVPWSCTDVCRQRVSPTANQTGRWLLMDVCVTTCRLRCGSRTAMVLLQTPCRVRCVHSSRDITFTAVTSMPRFKSFSDSLTRSPWPLDSGVVKGEGGGRTQAALAER